MTDQPDFILKDPVTHHETDLHDFIWMAGTGEGVLARISVENLFERDHNTYGEVTVWWFWDRPADSSPIVGPTRTNLSSVHHSGWKSLVKACEERVDNVSWNAAFQDVVYKTLQHYREGDAPTALGIELDRIEFGPPYILKPFISSSGTTVMYGQGGLSKSLVALAMSLSVATGLPIMGQEPTVTGPVIFFDYEDDPTVHQQRLLAMCRAIGIDPNGLPLHHMSLVSKVSSSKSAMKRRIVETGAVLAVLDSIGMARGGDAFGPDETIRLFRTFRGFGVPVLAIDHIAKATKGEQAKMVTKGQEVDAYGSAYTMNAARLAFWMRPIAHELDTIKLEMRNTKANHVRRVDPCGFVIEYENQEDIPYRIHIRKVEAFGDEVELLPKAIIMENLLKRRGPMSVEAIAEEFGWPRNRVDTILSRDRKAETATFKRVGSQRPMLVGLSNAQEEEDEE